MSNGTEYEVGYRKPPKHAQFKKGRSGNPKGRPKGSRNFSTDVKATLSRPVRLTENGRQRTVSTQLASLARLREKALSGDNKALDKLLDLARMHNDEEMADAAAATLTPSDSAILEDYTARLRRQDVPADRSNDRPVSDPAEGDIEEDDDAWLR